MLIAIITVVVLLAGFMVAFGAPYVPTKPKELRRAFTELYTVNPRDCLVDMGSGDGIVLRAFVRQGGRRAVGYEINPILVLISKFLARRMSGIETRLGNFWRAEFPSETTLIYLFGDSRDIRRLQHKIQKEVDRLGHSVHVMSYGFQLPDQTPLRQLDAHYLYEMTPLQPSKAQV